MAVANNIAEKRMLGKQLLSPAFWLYLLLGMVAVAIISFILFQPITVLPRIALAPGFGLQNGDGVVVSNEDLRGTITLYSFSAVNCASACGQTAADIAVVAQTLASQIAAPLNVVTLALNGETPADLAGLGSKDRSVTWQWLTGDSQRLRYVVGGGFNLYYDQQGGSVDFAPRYVLVDGLGMIRAYYFTAQPDPTLLLRDINFLLEEATNSTGSKKLAYEAAHLFLCYPD